MSDMSRDYDPVGEGWLIFAGLILMMAGAMRFFDAIWAWSYNGAVPDRLQNALFGHSLTTYGWVWLVVAILLFVGGFAVMFRSQFFRWFGIAAAAIGAIRRDLVDAVLPDLVPHLHRCLLRRHLCPGCPRAKRTSVSCVQSRPVCSR